MGTETERKFLVQNNWRDYVDDSNAKHVMQGYLPRTALGVIHDDHRLNGKLTIKFLGDGQGEYFTYSIPDEEARAIQSLRDISVRVRIKTKGKKQEAFLTIKSATPGLTRPEFEYGIPVADVQRLFTLQAHIGSIIDKVRYAIPYGDLTIELDQFFGDNEGLVVAEVELPDENTAFTLPGWFGPEVTNEPFFYNERLRTNPAKNWLQDWLNAH